jgi:hypothetical protein
MTEKANMSEVLILVQVRRLLGSKIPGVSETRRKAKATAEAICVMLGFQEKSRGYSIRCPYRKPTQVE